MLNLCTFGVDIFLAVKFELGKVGSIGDIAGVTSTSYVPMTIVEFLR